MALINPGWVDKHGTTHEEAYVCISKIDLDIFKSMAKITIHHYHDGNSKDARYRPILVETKVYSGEDYNNIFSEGEDSFLASVYSVLVAPDRSDNADYQEMENVFEVMLVDKLGKSIDEEISRWEAVELNHLKLVDEDMLIEDQDWHSVAVK